MKARWLSVTLILILGGAVGGPAGAQTGIRIEKATNGQDADVPPGPALVVGDPVTWTYRVTNEGFRDLTDIEVTDDVEGAVTCPATRLMPGESMTCTLVGTVQSGQYANVGTASGLLPNEDLVTDTDPSHYFGQAAPSIDLEKATNGVDADTAPGPVLPVGSTVTWTFEVTNIGTETLTNVQVVDDPEGPVACPAGTLDPGESMTCTVIGTVQSGQYANLGTVTATLPDTTTVADNDPSHHVGQLLVLEKLTNGADADLPPGPTIAVGDPITWSYEVSNPGPATVTDLTVTDDQGVVVTCPVTTLAQRESTVCTGSGFALPGQYENVGTATATLPGGAQVTGSDSSHYFGEGEIFDFGDAPDPTYPTLLASDGARHEPGTVFLGACIDYEIDGQPTAAADGDDSAAGLTTTGTCASPGDDENGVVFTTPLLLGRDTEIEVTASAACTLSAWIDFDQDGDWADAGEDLFPGGQALTAGANPLSFPVPAGALEGSTLARFRCTTDGAVGVTGAASDGEVEDYQVTVSEAAPAAISASKSAALVVDADGDGVADPGDTIGYTVVVANTGQSDATGVSFADTPDPNTALVVGSVTTTQGTVVGGNVAGDETVAVDVGTLAAGASVTITFEVTVDDSLPVGLEEVVNQGLVSADGLVDVPTDDPAGPGAADPTAVAVDAPTVLEIPTLDHWALLLLGLLLAAVALRRLLGGGRDGPYRLRPRCKRRLG